ncbi:aminotransferase class V-fold PLP-dependent enzyme [Patulibacter defluvii]|uniref:aminotransferase class V-fold PLP-dependent enzyme n=1 Tax=Patulibacter defluvii TaxID=3095358 RepID=UPI002A7583EE|nr:aminotransferase class V-fold PLP-dependent enzyme [Patulibacter sp. DM4]
MSGAPGGAAGAVAFDVEAVRRRFSSLGRGFRFLDAPGGSQVPDEVGTAIADALRDASGNLGAPYATGDRVAAILEDARAAAGRLLGAPAAEVAFGLNMTTLNFALSRVAGRELEAGDEIVVTRLDHDANVAPWLELAADRELVVRTVDVLPGELRLDLDDLRRQLGPRTRIVAFPWASNVVGTVIDAAEVCRIAHEAGALAWVDAVHYAAHAPLQAEAIGADVLLCSPYKFCGPHLGMAYVRRSVAESWRPYKARPGASEPFGRRFETGTPPFEALAGLIACERYLVETGALSPEAQAHEHALGERFLAGLPEAVEVYGPATMEERVSTFLLNVAGVPAREVALTLADRGYGVWHHDHYYALGLDGRRGYDHEAVRLGFAHYNTADEVDGLLAELGRIAAAAGE